MKHFIDLGAYTGDTVREFQNWVQLIDKPENWTVHSFEPNPNLHDQMIRVSRDYNNVIFDNSAAWIADGFIEFAADQSDTPMGSTVMQGKHAIWDISPRMRVKCFDFSQWLKKTFNENDHVIVKMDIEGAEFPVLEKMIKDHSITIPKLLLVEFHANKVRDYTTDNKNELIERVHKAGGNLKQWH